ncbi:C40 family peptidase [Sphaerimonospora thailandensis]|uniref:Glycoside hydrolase n=1 Tax=Sphaerimonospora thailandensis TaxID=795644 RepID=A0A8J3RAP0_9ACTN|nr:C40 family peptidase [Sphaerimonospora thailandensis]GIH70821.1 glycoside hydrolase [Sphaerimonospora thailandensis]
MPLLRASGLVAGLGTGLVLTLGGAAGADPRPSAEDVAKARATAQERAHELDKVGADLVAARARQDDLAQDAEGLVEAYNGELVRLEAIKASYEQATRRLRGAADQVREARAAVAAEATASYGGVSYGALDLSVPGVLVEGLGDIGDLLQRASLLTHMSDARVATLERLRDTLRVHEILRAQAAQAYTAQLRATERVRLARDTAQEAVDRQMETTRRIEQEKRELSRRLEAARSRVDELRRAKREPRRHPAREPSAAGRRGGRNKILAWVGRLGAGRGGLAAQWALKQLGKPYVWAADGPSGFDCSGLTMRAWQRAGVSLDHWTGTQWTSGRHVSLKNLRTGDLVFYGSLSRDPGTIRHVGIYIGRGLMVHAPRTGDVVRISPIWRHDLVGATRPDT